jgi:hypothetical protein
MVQDIGYHVQTTTGQRGVSGMCVLDRDDAVLVTRDDQGGQICRAVQLVERADRLTAVVDDGAQRAQERLPVISIRQSGLRPPRLAEPADLALGCLSLLQPLPGRKHGT